MLKMKSVCEDADPQVMLSGFNSLEGMIAQLTAFIASLTAGKVTVGLFKEDLVIGPGSDYAALFAAKANYDGYAAVDLAPNAPGLNPDGWVQADVPTAHFVMTGGHATPNTIYGWWMYDKTAEFLIKAARLDSPFTITLEGDYLDVEAFIGIKDNSQF